MFWKHDSLYFLTHVLRVSNIRRMHLNLISAAINHMSLCYTFICPHAKKRKDSCTNHEEKSIRRNLEEGIVYIYAKTIWQATYVNHMVLMLCSLLMVYAYLLTLFFAWGRRIPVGMVHINIYWEKGLIFPNTHTPSTPPPSSVTHMLMEGLYNTKYTKMFFDWK